MVRCMFSCSPSSALSSLYTSFLHEIHWLNFNQPLRKVPFNERKSPFTCNYLVKIHWRLLKLFFSRTVDPISTINSVSRIDNSDIVNIHWGVLKNHRANFNLYWLIQIHLFLKKKNKDRSTETVCKFSKNLDSDCSLFFQQ